MAGQAMVELALVLPVLALLAIGTVNLSAMYRAWQAADTAAAEGARYAAFVERWIPLEEGYFAKYAIPQSADLILDTEKGMIVP